MGALRAEFAPPWWLRNAHVQTLGAAVPPLPRAAPVRPDEGTVALASGEALLRTAWWQPEPRPALLLVHGLGGSSQSAYIRHGLWHAYRAGYHAAAVTLRGSGPGGPLARSLYHAGLTEDLEATLAWLASQPRVRGVGLIGFSLGGQVSLRLVSAPAPAPPPVAGLVTVSTPFDLEAAATHIDHWRQAPYRFYMLRALVANALALAARAPERVPASPARLRALRTIRAYDDEVIAPMHGFGGARAYYDAVACGPWLDRVRVPTLCLYAADDPMVPASTLRPFVKHASELVTFRETAQGGHVGFSHGPGQAPWAVARALEFLRARLPPV
ncbi:MAG TPA: alpha/beta fold hydrolase [Polyangiaceae bacterium]|nr:alpha/beta fold hydrolase [Polyangiaceae bacterium]